MYFGYFSFYLLILTFTLYIYYFRSKHSQQAIFQLSASLYIFYFIFILIPSEGPQFYFTANNNLPPAYIFQKIMWFIQEIAEQPTGAFPSSHVGISLVILFLSRKMAPNFFQWTWPLVVILIFSTVYIKAHYIVDVIAGLLMAPIVLWASKSLYNLPLRANTKSRT